MKKAVVDVTDCKDLRDLHKRFQAALEFPDHYGENLDAFWDCIHRDCDVNFVTVVGSETVSDELKSTLDAFFEMMEENKKAWAPYDWLFDYEIV